MYCLLACITRSPLTIDRAAMLSRSCVQLFAAQLKPLDSRCVAQWLWLSGCGSVAVAQWLWRGGCGGVAVTQWSAGYRFTQPFLTNVGVGMLGTTMTPHPLSSRQLTKMLKPFSASLWVKQHC